MNTSKYRARLIALRAAVSGGSGPQMSEIAQPVSHGNGEHTADAAAETMDFEFAVGVLGRSRNALREIDDALRRIEEGTFGVCEYSGQRIPVARLDALPFCRYTVEVQAQIERGLIAVRRGRRGDAPVPAWADADEDPQEDGEEELAVAAGGSADAEE